jgi:hypothetical protein
MHNEGLTNDVLDSLVLSKDISSYSYQEVPEEESKFRKTEKLELTFPSGRKLVLDTFCSGSSENTCLIISQ